jgi:RluA family pseudouridine synthase
VDEDAMPIKAPSKKHQPRGLKFVYEDQDILVVDKASGLLTVGSATESEKTAYFLLNDYVRKGQAKSRKRVFVVHRLDKDTSGLLVFAKSEEAKLYLQDQWKGFTKMYYAVVEGAPAKDSGEYSSYLAENVAHHVYSTRDGSKGKLARTGYRAVKKGGKFSLLEVDLHTGRKNQIRVHMADLGHQVAGDAKYGAKHREVKRLCLHSAALTLLHPHTKREIYFKTPPPEYFKQLALSR